MYFGHIRPEMIEIKIFRKIKILTPLNLEGQIFLLDWIARVKVPPPPLCQIWRLQLQGYRSQRA